jgi:hypothetical protein
MTDGPIANAETNVGVAPRSCKRTSVPLHSLLEPYTALPIGVWLLASDKLASFTSSLDSYPDEQVKKLHLDHREYKSYKIYPGSLTAVA